MTSQSTDSQPSLREQLNRRADQASAQAFEDCTESSFTPKFTTQHFDPAAAGSSKSGRM
ncbi:MAG: hypothetical protein HON23_02455 [Rickettsiales bacterium]|nr:hypothetical protein [Rickettsiales bacterium]